MTLPPHLLGLQNNDFMSTTPNYGHRATQSFAVKPSANGMNGGFHTSQQSVGGITGFAERQQRNNIQPINTNRAAATGYNANDLQTPGTAYDMNFTPLLPSQLLMGSPFQAGSPTTFQSPHFQSFPTFSQQDANGRLNQSQMNQAQNPFHQIPGFSPPGYHLASPPAMGPGSYFGLPAPTPGFNPLNGGGMGYVNPMQVASGVAQGTSRTVYLGNIPPETSAEEILGHVRSGQIESVRLLPDKNCAFISFLDGSSATHFHSDAILKKLSIKGQDIKIGWGKPSSVPTSVAIAVQQSGASRNVYLGNLPEEITDEEVREDLSKFGPIDTIKIVREKSIGFVHFLSIGNAIKAVTQLPQEPKWHAPRRVYYGKDRCAYVSKTQQQNAAQYLGIAPGYAHVLNGADRDLITSALAQQSVAAAAVATTAGGVNNLGNRTVYLGNIHPETTLEEICNVVRGGLLHHVRYIPDKHICFVTFIDPTSAASFYALSNLQGLMIHNRRLKIGWGKHSGALPPAIALAVSGGASRNVYVGNLDESWHEERLRQDFQEYGEIELVNTLREKNCAFVNFTNIANAIKAIEAIRGKEDYKRFKVNFGKDRCGNAPRHNHKEQHLEMSMSPSPINGLAPSRTQNSISPISSGANAAGAYNPMHGPTASTVFNTGSANPLTMYLAATQQQNAQAAGQDMQEQRHDSSPSEYAPQSHHTQPSSHLSTQQAFYNSPNEVSVARSSGLEAANGHVYGHGSHQSVSFANGMPMNSYSSARMNQHSRTVSLPAFSLQQAPVNQHNSILGGLGSGLASFGTYGLGVSNEGSLPGWAEEEVA